MSRLLLNEYPLLVLPSLAKAIGLNEAIVLQQIHYWLQTYKQADDKSHFRDGQWWVWNSVREWQNGFPFWSESTVKRTLASLRQSYPPEDEERQEGDPKVSRGPLLNATSQYNKKNYDKTLWYSIRYDEVARLEKALGQNDQRVSKALGQNDPMDLVKMTQPIPETTTETTGTETTAAAQPAQNGDFAQALRAYQDSFGPLGSSFKYQKFQMLWDEYPDRQVHEYAREEMYEAMMDDKRRVHPNLNYYAECLATGKARASPRPKHSPKKSYDSPDLSDPAVQEWIRMHDAGTLPYYED